MAEPKVVLVARNRAPSYYEKARQFCKTASAALDSGQHDAALLCAVHAGISGADAVSVALAGRRSTDADHLRAADLLEQIASQSPPIKQKADQLRALIKQKNRVEYEDRRTSASDARDAVERCRRFVDWAGEELKRARLIA